MPDLRIGISGWTYAGWRGDFYPQGLQHRRELEYASRRLNSIEINGSFYSLQKPASYRRWAEETPEDFVFSVKGSRFITHMRKLRDVRIPLANFFASGVLLLGEKLGPLLWQFPEQFGYAPERMEQFLALLPKTTREATELAQEHMLVRPGGFSIEPVPDRPLRHAFEMRNPGWFVPKFISMLRRHQAALVFADSAGHWPYAEDLTADFIYLRLHGAEELYASGYTDEGLDWWAERIQTWQAGGEPDDALHAGNNFPHRAEERDAFVYFDNDAKVRAPYDAMGLMERLSEPGESFERTAWKQDFPSDQPGAS
jgi:uncharacterized protein YecE (DUF72 family)